jgi:hypothetical protein
MPFDELRPLTLDEINEAIREMECSYATSSAAFVKEGPDRFGVPEDDAMEWHFLLMQKVAFEADASGPRYQDLRSNVRTGAVDDQEAMRELAA